VLHSPITRSLDAAPDHPITRSPDHPMDERFERRDFSSRDSSQCGTNCARRSKRSSHALHRFERSASIRPNIVTLHGDRVSDFGYRMCSITRRSPHVVA
jgi:hypothetical protein